MPIRISGMNSGLDTESLVSALTSGYRTKVENYQKAQTKLQWKQDAWKSTNTKIYSLYTSINNLRFTSGYQMKKSTVSDATKATVSSGSNATVGTHTLKVKQLAQSAYMTGGALSVKSTDENGEEVTSKATSSTKLSELGITGEDGTVKFTYAGTTKEIKVGADTTVSSFVASLKDAGVQANFDETHGRIYIAAQKSGTENDFSFEGTEGTGLEALAALGLTEDAGAIKMKPQDAEIELDGATYTGTSNSFAINGLTIEATGVTDDNGITITTSNDVSGLYDKVKDFLSTYNEVVNELTSLYNADSAKGYDPLTDDEKSAMSDSEIEKWEDKIKTSLLRRDSTLEGVISAMTSSMATGYEVNGKTYSWSSFGVHTLGFLNAAENEQNAYHIDGDEDDSNTSGNTDKLMAAISSDPDSFISFMQQSVNGLYKAIDNKMKSTSMRSAYNVYNDKEMASEYSDYTDLIKTWQTRLEDLESSYYTKFSNMESALATLQSNSSSLTSMLG